MNEKSGQRGYFRPFTGAFNVLKVSVAIASSSVLVACGSGKPTSGDIERGLATFYACPWLEVADTKKTNGQDGANGQYVVEYSFQVKLKNGKEGASKFFTKLTELDDEISAKNQAAKDARSVASGWEDPRLANAEASENAAKKKRNEFIGDCTPTASTLIWQMQSTVLANIQEKPTAVRLPIAAPMIGEASMVKTEQGWQMTGMPITGGEKFIFSEPMKFDVKRQETEPMAAAEPLSPPAKLATIDATPGDPVQGSAQESSMQGPSFDCAKASTSVEKAICSDPKLAEMDVKMVAAYKGMLAAASDKDAFKKTHANWRKNIRDVCANPACIAAAYQQRLADLQ